jgi:hypothetical protein
MRWRKHGVVWQPDGAKAWARTHATCPTPLMLDDGTLRVYLQCRDAKSVGRIGFVDLDPADPRRVLREADEPVLDVGAAGAFDDNGVFQTSIVKRRRRRELSSRLRSTDPRALVARAAFPMRALCLSRGGSLPNVVRRRRRVGDHRWQGNANL